MMWLTMWLTRTLPRTLLCLLCAFVVGPHTGAAQTRARRKPHAPAAQPVRYACPMDPEVVAHKPGKCPKCGMALRLVKPDDAPPPAATAPATAAAAPVAGTADTAAPRIPDVAVLDQTGRTVHFYSDLIKGKTVAINFIFTTCTTICPPLTATFRRVQQQLGPRVGNDVQLISISVDPTTDTPARLQAYAAKFRAEPGWTFITGDRPTVNQLLAALGAAVGNPNDHTPMVVVGNDTTGQWTRTYGLAPAATLVKVINDTAAH